MCSALSAETGAIMRPRSAATRSAGFAKPWPCRTGSDGAGQGSDRVDLLALFGMVEMAGILRELGTLPFGGVAGMEGLCQLGGGNGLVHGDMQFLVEQPFMGFLDVDGLPDCRHRSDSFAV